MKRRIQALIAAVSITASLQAQNITFNADTLYPEGIAYYKAKDVFFVSSLRHGKIGTVDRKGNYSVFVNSPEMISAIGIHLNEKTNTLFVCTSDPGVSTKTGTSTQRKFAKLIAYDVTTATQKFIADLGALNPTGFNFANDVTFDEAGNCYVTNSFSPIIYKIDSNGTPSIFANSDAWKADGFSLNGIVYHSAGFLIVAQSNTGNLYKVSLNNPTTIKKIDSEPILGADGMIYNSQKDELIVISNASQEIIRLKSENQWDNAKKTNTVKSITTFPTTGTIVGNSYFVLNAKLNELFNPTSPKTSSFIIQEVKF